MKFDESVRYPCTNCIRHSVCKSDATCAKWRNWFLYCWGLIHEQYKDIKPTSELDKLEK